MLRMLYDNDDDDDDDDDNEQGRPSLSLKPIKQTFHPLPFTTNSLVYLSPPLAD